MITGSDDRLVKIWSMETAYCLASCRGHEVSFKLIVLRHSHFPFLFLVLSNSFLHLFIKGDITDLAVNANNTLVASASNDCIIRVVRFLFWQISLILLFLKTGCITDLLS